MLGEYDHNFLSFEAPAFMGSGCCGCRLLELYAATISRIQFAQRSLTCIYGMKITGLTFGRCGR